jgi:hypothetical protein
VGAGRVTITAYISGRFEPVEGKEVTCTTTDGIISRPSRFGLTEAVMGLSVGEGMRVGEEGLCFRNWVRGGDITRGAALGWAWLSVRVLLATVGAVDLTPIRTPSLLHFVLRPLARVVVRVLESRTLTAKSSAKFRTVHPMEWERERFGKCLNVIG